MSTYNKHAHDKLDNNSKVSLNMCFLEQTEDSKATQIRARISIGKQAVGVNYYL